jgi:hypothetical protein
MPLVIAKPVTLVAHQHDGTWDSAHSLSDWLLDLGCTAVSVDKDSNHVYFVDPKIMGRQIIFTNWWVVRFDDKSVRSMSEREFKSRFVLYPS